MNGHDLYSSAHLVVAAIRIIEHQTNAPPTVEDVGNMLSFSLEQASFVCHKLHEMGIIEAVEGAYDVRLYIVDHLKIEKIPQCGAGTNLEKEVKKFKDSRKDYTEKIKTIQAQQEEKKKNLFSELEKQLKKGLDKK
ncbi:MAG: hypothetical protein PHP23_00670 [Desulfobacterales bacterium]|nr:hypothetical protein [Desulfobacterales bacterium]MDD4071063.1 hypothetical protein [Desulfobacterales bacterium]MDD4392460.1 hypothetical protein [Desulfobacterales bacterium]